MSCFTGPKGRGKGHPAGAVLQYVPGAARAISPRSFTAPKEGKELTEEVLRGEKEEEYCPKCGTMYPDRERRICPKCMNKSSVFFRTIGLF